jgi:hypothetical protein
MKQSVIDSSFLRGVAALGRSSLEPASHSVKLAQRYHKGPRRHDEQQQSGRRLFFFQCKIEERRAAGEKHHKSEGGDGSSPNTHIDVPLDQSTDGIHRCFATPLASQPANPFGGAARTNTAVTMFAGAYGIGLRMVEALHRQPPNR